MKTFPIISIDPDSIFSKSDMGLVILDDKITDLLKSKLFYFEPTFIIKDGKIELLEISLTPYKFKKMDGKVFITDELLDKEMNK